MSNCEIVAADPVVMWADTKVVADHSPADFRYWDVADRVIVPGAGLRNDQLCCCSTT